jgi:hypothetical protein
MVRVAGLVVLVLSAGLIVAGCGSSKSSAAAGANVTGTPVAVSSTTTATTTTTTRPGHKRVLPLTGEGRWDRPGAQRPQLHGSVLPEPPDLERA